MEGMDINVMLVFAVIGGLIMLVGGFITLASVMEMQTPTSGTYIMLIGIIIVCACPLSIMIFKNIKGWLKI